MALARALIREPKLLLLDEPLGALDKRLREAMQVELRAIQRQVGITFLLVTHDQEEALSLSDRVAVMESGRILQVATPRALYERPNCRAGGGLHRRDEFLSCDGAPDRGYGSNRECRNSGHGHLSARQSGAGIKIDEHILLAIRPEHVRFAGAGLAGEIADATFLGERSHFHVRIAGRSELVAVSGSTAPAGKAVHLAFAPENLIGLPSEFLIAMGGLDPHIKSLNRRFYPFGLDGQLTAGHVGNWNS